MNGITMAFKEIYKPSHVRHDVMAVAHLGIIGLEHNGPHDLQFQKALKGAQSNIILLS